MAIQLPNMIVNGIPIEGRKVAFDMNYDAAKAKHGNDKVVVCPSDDLIFHWND